MPDMAAKKNRVYNSEVRRTQAVQTKHRILTQAKALFQSEGFDSVTIEQLAQVANVSAPTIYALFQSKRGIVQALIQQAFPSDQFEALAEKVIMEKSPTNRLKISAKIARKINDAEKALMDIFRGASVLGPELREIERDKEQLRYERQERTIKLMKQEGSLIKGLSLAKARAILWAFTGRDMYRMFVVQKGWSSNEYEKWLGQLLIKTLVAVQ